MPVKEYKKVVDEQRQLWAQEKGVDLDTIDVPPSQFKENPRVSTDKELSESELQQEHMRYIFDGVTFQRLYKLKF